MATYNLRSKVDISFIDHSRETSKTTFYVAPLLADGSNRAAILTSVQLMHAAISALTLCNLGSGGVSMYDIMEIPTTPTDENAQREQGLWVQYVDNTTGKFYSMTIPGVDRTLVAQINTDEVDIVSNVAAAAFVADFELNCRSELGNTVSVTRMRLVGKAT